MRKLAQITNSRKHGFFNDRIFEATPIIPIDAFSRSTLQAEGPTMRSVTVIVAAFVGKDEGGSFRSGHGGEMPPDIAPDYFVEE